MSQAADLSQTGFPSSSNSCPVEIEGRTFNAFEDKEEVSLKTASQAPSFLGRTASCSPAVFSNWSPMPDLLGDHHGLACKRKAYVLLGDYSQFSRNSFDCE